MDFEKSASLEVGVDQQYFWKKNSILDWSGKTSSIWVSRIVAIPADCKSVAIRLRRFESYLTHHLYWEVVKWTKTAAPLDSLEEDYTANVKGL